MEHEYKPVPKSRCYSIAQIISAMASASESIGYPLSLYEATHALDSIYGRSKVDMCEMLFDGAWQGLAEPYSAKYAPKQGIELENIMIDVICELQNVNWNLRSEREIDRHDDVSHILVLKEDAETIFERAWRFLHGDKPLPELKSFCDSSQCSVFDVDKVEKQDAIVTDVITCKTGIKSPTHDRLQRAIDAFSSRYPERFVRPPKLDTDIRPWLKETGMALSDREAHVFGVILAEHFNLSPDTQKP